MNSPALPCILYTPRKQFEVCHELPGSLSNWRAVKWHRKHPSFVFDSNGNHWREILSVDEGSFGLFARLFNLARPVRMSFEEAAPISVKEMVKILCEIVDNDPDDLWCQWMTHEQVKHRLRRQKTPSDLIWFAGDLGLTEFNKEVNGE